MKKKFIACVVACATLLMGTGYAYWTNNITLNAKVTTGKFDVQITDADYNNEFTEYAGNDHSPNYRTSDHTLDTNGFTDDSVNLSLTDLYPGYGQSYTFKLENKGTLAAKLSEIVFTKTGWTDVMKKMVGVNISVDINNVKYAFIFGESKWVEVTQVPANNATGANFFALKGDSYARLSALDSITGTANSADKFLFLDTKSTPISGTYSDMYVTIKLAMDPDAAGTYTSGSTSIVDTVATPVDSDSQSLDKTLNVTFEFDQYNQH